MATVTSTPGHTVENDASHFGSLDDLCTEMDMDVAGANCSCARSEEAYTESRSWKFMNVGGTTVSYLNTSQ